MNDKHNIPMIKMNMIHFSKVRSAIEEVHTLQKKSAGKFSAAETCRVTSSCLASFGMHLQRFLAQAAGLEARKTEKTKLQKAFGKL